MAVKSLKKYHEEKSKVQFEIKYVNFKFKAKTPLNSLLKCCSLSTAPTAKTAAKHRGLEHTACPKDGSVQKTEVKKL